jgi:hypothetical protein
MEKHRLYKTAHMLLMVCLIFPACVKYHQFSKSEFPQGKEKTIQKDIIGRNVRTANVYDEFQTEAIFDALYLSSEVRDFYTNAYSERRGKDEKFRESMLLRGLEENKHWISFYVLAYIPRDHRRLMSDQDPSWSLYLELPNGERLTPARFEQVENEPHKVSPGSIKETELAPEYAALFKHHINQFKTVYLVKFPSKGFDNTVKYPTKPIKLVFSSVYRSVEMTWGRTGERCTEENDVLITKRKSKQYEDFYWL